MYQVLLTQSSVQHLIFKTLYRQAHWSQPLIGPKKFVQVNLLSFPQSHLNSQPTPFQSLPPQPPHSINFRTESDWAVRKKGKDRVWHKMNSAIKVRVNWIIIILALLTRLSPPFHQCGRSVGGFGRVRGRDGCSVLLQNDYPVAYKADKVKGRRRL